jgi:hypothetical protein
VFVVPIHGGVPHLVYESDPWLDDLDPFEALADWTAGGQYLVVKGTREGSNALFLLPIKNGAVNGSQVFVRVGNFSNTWSAFSGALAFEDRPTVGFIQRWRIASIDSRGKIEKWEQVELNRRTYPAFPSFSPDAKQIAYPSKNPTSPGIDLIVKDISTGRERVAYQSDADRSSCQYSAVRPVVFCTSWNVNGKTDLVSVSVDSGAVEQIATFPDPRYLIPHPPDDKVFYFVSDRGNGGQIDPKLMWDLTTQKETFMADAVEVGDSKWGLSLDGRWLLRQLNGELTFRPASGGDWKTLASGIENFNMLGSTPDGNWAVYLSSDSEGHPGIFKTPFSGGEPQRLGNLPDNVRSPDCFLVFSPDARKILAIDFGPPQYSLWILENFEPKTPK